jgi:signal transduction histidine kinase
MKPRSRKSNQQTLGSVPIFVALISLAITAMCWIAAYHYVQVRDQGRFDTALQNVKNIISERLERQENLIEATHAMVELNPSIHRSDFIRYVDALDLTASYPGSAGLGWSEYIRPDQVQDFLIRLDGASHLPLMKFAGELHAVMALHPKRSDVVSTGFNMFVEPNRRAAMIQARDTGKRSMTGRIQAILGPDKDASFIIYEPVYTIRHPKTVAERRKSLRGFVYTVFKANDLFEHEFSREVSQGLRVEVYGTNDVVPSELLYVVGPGESRANAAFHQTESVGQIRPWALVVESTPLFESQSGSGLLIWIPISGVLIAALLTSLTGRQATAAREIAEQADRLERKVAQQQLLAETGQLVNEHLDYTRTLSAISKLAVPGFADYCTIDMPDPGGLIQRISITHRDPAMISQMIQSDKRFPDEVSGDSMVAQVLRTGKPVLLENVDYATLRRRPAGALSEELSQAFEAHSAMIVPMVARGRTLGAMTFATCGEGRRYDQEDLVVAVELGNRAGMAIDNSVLFTEAQRERAEVRRLNERLEFLVHERTAELERSNRELEAFSYSVSHDLRGPLRSVDGFSRALFDDYGEVLDDTAKGYIMRVRTAAKRMDQLITSLLSLSRITRSTIVREKVDVTKIALEAADEVEMAADRPVEIVVQPGLTAEADGKMLSVVFQNLIGNAVKFSSKEESPRVEVTMRAGVFCVKDNGVGFNPQYSAKLFAPFERLHGNNQFGGSGIGLATVERIVKRHGGRIWAESEEGKGATFYFTLQ